MKLDADDFPILLRPDVRRDQVNVAALNPLVEKEREKLQAIHPLKRRRYLLPTSPNLEAFATTARLVDQSQSGAIFYAKTRFGKTCAQRYLVQIIKRLVPHVTLIRFLAAKRKTPNPAGPAVDLARALNLNTNLRPERLFELVVNALWTRAAEEGSDDLIIVIDEGNRYQEAEFDGLMNITNALEEFGFRTTTLIWGQRSLNDYRDVLLSDRDDIVERLMPLPFKFYGIRSAGDLRTTFAKFDRASEFPVGSGKSFPWMFMHRAVEGGLLASELAEPLWAEFTAVARESDLYARVRGAGIGMNWISLAIEDLLTQHTDHDHPKWRPTKHDYTEAVASSLFQQALRTAYVDPSDDLAEEGDDDEPQE